MADHITVITPAGNQERQRVTHLLLQYSYLQVLDFLTTIAFLLHGVKEGNPLVRFMVSATSSPINGLLVVKLLAVLLGLYCWRTGRAKLLGPTNIMFPALLAW